MKYSAILFDFDGTLFDTSEGILKGIRTALESAGIVGPQEGSKPRQVLISDLDTLEELLSSIRK